MKTVIVISLNRSQKWDLGPKDIFEMDSKYCQLERCHKSPGHWVET
jgi:hypothetical protein